MNHISTFALGFFVTTSLFAEPNFVGWKGFSDPDIMSSGFTHSLEALPLEGSILNGSRAWSGHYWPSREGGINNRWNTKNPVGFKYSSPSETQVKAMSLEQLKTLSPSEKFDLYMGRYNYPLKTEASGSASRSAPDWAGICHGWAPASLHHNEPTPKVVANPQGIQIPFGSADIKALLSYYYAFYFETPTNQMGLRCFFGRWLGGVRGCNEDLNAGAFHIVMANKLGLQKEGFLMDKEPQRQVWNQPVVGFKSQIISERMRPSRSAARAAVAEIRVATDLYFTDESLPQWNVVQGTENQKIEAMKLQYRLDIDSRGKIVGGTWESDERPDFLWNKGRAQSYTGLLEKLDTLLND